MISNPHRRRRAAILTVAFLAWLAAGTLLSKPEEAEGPESRSAFAGAATCADCHGEIHDRWARTGHARTFRAAAPDILPPEMVLEGGVSHPPSSSRFRREAGGVVVETLGDRGAVESFPVTDVVGVRRIRMFLTRLQNGRRQVLPFMQEGGTGDWFDYSHLIFGPGADPQVPPKIRPGEPSFWTGMQRFYDAGCARCHTSGWKWRGEAGNGDWSGWRARGVDCESCHGPGADHVAFQSGEPGITEDPVLRLGMLPRDRAVGVCLQCHMEAEVTAHGFRPGDDPFDHYDPTLLSDTLRVDATGRPLELIYDGLPFLSSTCARKGRLRCTTCHDPHGGPYRGQTRVDSRSDGLCSECHAQVVRAGKAHSRHEPGGPGGSCTACHMPFLTIERGHGAVTDHTIGVPSPRLDRDGMALDACNACHSRARGAPGGSPLLTRERVASAFEAWWPESRGRPEWAEVIEEGRRGAPGAPERLAALARDGSAPRVARASAARLLARQADVDQEGVMALLGSEDGLVRRQAAAAMERVRGETADAVLQGALFDPSAAVRDRAAAAALAGGWSRVRASRSLLDAVLVALQDRVERVPEDDTAWFRLGAARQIAGDIRGAVRAYRKKLALDPYATRVKRAVAQLEAELERLER